MHFEGEDRNPVVRRLAHSLIACLWLQSAGTVHALNPDRAVAQYKHTIWTAEQGVPRNISALAQGRDGYIWIGAATGLFRFDGITFEHIVPQRSMAYEGERVQSLLAARDGTIWVGYRGGGVGIFRDGKLTDGPAAFNSGITISLAQGRDGAIWARLSQGPDHGRLVRYADGKLRDYTDQLGPADARDPRAMAIARDGTVWATTWRGIYILKPGTNRFVRTPFDIMATPTTGSSSLAEDPDGHMWLKDPRGSRALTPGAVKAPFYPTPHGNGVTTLFDHEGNLWSAVPNKTYFRLRLPSPGGPGLNSRGEISQFTLENDPTGYTTITILEDREGNIWMGGTKTLEVYRDADLVPELSIPAPGDSGRTLIGSKEGSIYFSNERSVTRVLPKGQPETIFTTTDFVETLCHGRQSDIWIVTDKQVINWSSGRTKDFPAPKHTDRIQTCVVDPAGDLWISGGDGVFRLRENKFQKIPLPLEQQFDYGQRPIAVKNDGSLLMFKSSQSIITLRPSGVTTTRADHPDIFRGYRIIYPVANDVWLGGSFGLGRWRGQRINILSPSRLSLQNTITGVARSQKGDVWIFTGGEGEIVHLSEGDLNRAFDNPQNLISMRKYDADDGLPIGGLRTAHSSIAEGGDGRLWFATGNDPVWIDLLHPLHNPLPPTISISSLAASGKVFHDPHLLRLPKNTREVEIGFAVLSMTVPKRNAVRYRLDGVDEGWIDPGLRRRAYYTNLEPGTYSFHVIGSNNDGIWNRKGSTVQFVIPAAFYQTLWFKLLAALLVMGVLRLLYGLRLNQMAVRMRADLNIQLAERERIARELHDTLLQRFQGLTLRFQSIANRLPKGGGLRPEMDEALDTAEATLVEARKGVHDLRTVPRDFTQLMAKLAEELSTHWPAKFTLTIEGMARPLGEQLDDETQKIAEEALRNAFQHAQATNINTLIYYGRNELRFQVNDNGIGMPVELISAGQREGHFGMLGMRERAQRIGASLTFSSRPGGGTTVDLRVPLTPNRFTQLKNAWSRAWGRMKEK